MTVYVFTGPTISAAGARQELDAVYLPPVSQGDVYRVARLKPRAIGIIDEAHARLKVRFRFGSDDDLFGLRRSRRQRNQEPEAAC